MKLTDYGTAVNVTASSTSPTVFPSSVIPSAGLVGFQAKLTGTGHDFDCLSRIRVKAGGQSIVDVLETTLAAAVQRMSRGKHDLASTDTKFPIPLNFFDLSVAEGRNTCGFPRGKTCDVELVPDGTQSTGTALLGFEHTDPGNLLYSPLFLGQPMAIAASQTRARFQITQTGMLRGIVIPTTGLDRVILNCNGKTLVDTTGDNLVYAQMVDNKDGDVEPICMLLDVPEPLNGCELYLNTGAGWSGVANEVGVISYLPQVA